MSKQNLLALAEMYFGEYEVWHMYDDLLALFVRRNDGSIFFTITTEGLYLAASRDGYSVIRGKTPFVRHADPDAVAKWKDYYNKNIVRTN